MASSGTSLFAGRSLIFWDFDGTLADSEPVHYEAFIEAFAPFNHRFDRPYYFSTFTNLGLGPDKEISARNLSIDHQVIRQNKDRIYLDKVKSGLVSLFADVPAIIRAATGRGLKNCIVSNSFPEIISKVLLEASLDKEFIGVIGATEGMRKKPAPDLLFHAQKTFGYESAKILVVEDTQIGLEAAEAAGIEAIWLVTDINRSMRPSARYVAALTHQQLLTEMKLERKA